MNRRQFLQTASQAAAAASFPVGFSFHAAGATALAEPSFLSRLRPAVVGGGFDLPDYWVWCGAPIRGEDGRYHLFASKPAFRPTCSAPRRRVRASI